VREGVCVLACVYVCVCIHVRCGGVRARARGCEWVHMHVFACVRAGDGCASFLDAFGRIYSRHEQMRRAHADARVAHEI